MRVCSVFVLLDMVLFMHMFCGVYVLFTICGSWSCAEASNLSKYRDGLADVHFSLLIVLSTSV